MCACCVLLSLLTNLLLYNKIERIDLFSIPMTLCYYFVVIAVIDVWTKREQLFLFCNLYGIYNGTD